METEINQLRNRAPSGTVFGIQSPILEFVQVFLNINFYYSIIFYMNQEYQSTPDSQYQQLESLTCEKHLNEKLDHLYIGRDYNSKRRLRCKICTLDGNNIDITQVPRVIQEIQHQVKTDVDFINWKNFLANQKADLIKAVDEAFEHVGTMILEVKYSKKLIRQLKQLYSAKWSQFDFEYFGSCLSETNYMQNRTKFQLVGTEQLFCQKIEKLLKDCIELCKKNLVENIRLSGQFSEITFFAPKNEGSQNQYIAQQNNNQTQKISAINIQSSNLNLNAKNSLPIQEQSCFTQLFQQRNFEAGQQLAPSNTMNSKYQSSIQNKPSNQCGLANFEHRKALKYFWIKKFKSELLTNKQPQQIPNSQNKQQLLNLPNCNLNHLSGVFKMGDNSFSSIIALQNNHYPINYQEISEISSQHQNDQVNDNNCQNLTYTQQRSHVQNVNREISEQERDRQSDANRMNISPYNTKILILSPNSSISQGSVYNLQRQLDRCNHSQFHELDSSKS